MKKFCILYSGPIGSGKSPITNFISTKLNLPVFNTDSIRSEVCEDLLQVDEDEAQKRIIQRFNDVIKSGVSFIYDASVDSKWELIKKILTENGYEYYIISIDLQKDTLLKLYKAKSYTESEKRIDFTYENHQNFLKKYGDIVGLHINEQNYADRLNVVYSYLNKLKFQ